MKVITHKGRVHSTSNLVSLTICHVILPLFAGGLIYVLFRSSDIMMFRWIEHLGLSQFIDSLRLEFSRIKNWIPSWIYFSLPDGLWVYSFTSVLLLIWNGRINILVVLPLLLAALIEIGQRFRWYPGTFDIVDLALSTAALLFSTFILKSKSKTK